eukprot:TRINITY_DN85760_c0_g1_i3.p1 TRINITY_DN85760_c0_g1~~TRINITY_DN85760_c0_g1_i3.p1  ORF type:complete len:113 (+),score=27.94 TRINITY_DN85760_c0_g1_i3:336-674(+)
MTFSTDAIGGKKDWFNQFCKQMATIKPEQLRAKSDEKTIWKAHLSADGAEGEEARGGPGPFHESISGLCSTLYEAAIRGDPDSLLIPCPNGQQIGRAVQQECRDRSRMPSSA